MKSMIAAVVMGLLSQVCQADSLIVPSRFALLQGAVECDQNPKALAANKAAFAKADARLNNTWKIVRAKLAKDQFKALQDRQRYWPEYRDIMSATSAASRPAEAKETLQCADFYRVQTDITNRREKFLQAQIASVPAEPGAAWTGRFDDSVGGVLLAYSAKDGIHFSIDVVRSEGYHTGMIAGVAKLEGGKAIYRTTTDDYSTDDPNDQKPVMITLIRRGNVIEVETENTQNFGGARAYFDSQYARFEALSAGDRKELDQAVAGDFER
jgi:uncharacterized protein YecT (DUF1311 family)